MTAQGEGVGQRIEILGSRVTDDSMIITMNRSLTSADGEGFSSAEGAAGVSTFPAKLASDLFESDEEISRVYVASNVVVLRRDGGWSQDAGTASSNVIEEFFLYY